MPGAESTRERVLSDEELLAVWRASEVKGAFGKAVQLLILTGLRREEVGRLKWSEVNVAAGAITLSGERTKNGKPHLVPLSPAALALLQGMPRICEYVFTMNGSQPITSWSRVKVDLDELSEVTGWRTHDIRRTVVTGLQRLGANLQTIEAVLKHVTGSRSGVVGVYQRHSFTDEKRAALEAWGAYVMALVEGRPVSWPP
jgi:integrase